MTQPLTYEQIIEALTDAIVSSPIIGRPQARAALSALRALCDERGYRLAVPVEATEGMCEAARRIEPVSDVWRAMLAAAAPDPTKEPE